MKKIILSLLLIIVAVLIGCEPIEEPEVFGSIYGIVSDSQSGQPIANAEITLSPGNESTISGSTGRFEFKDLDAGQYKVSVQAEGYEFNNKQVTVVPGERVSCDISLIAKDGLKVEPSSLNFESIHTHLSVSITNIGGAEVAWQLDLQNVNWLSANPKSGRIASKKVQTIVFSVNRDYVSSEKSVVLNLTSNGNSYPIAISCLPKGTSKGELTLNKTSINFGETSSEEELELKNTGTAAVNWQLKDVVSTCISLSDSLGTIDAGGSKVIKVYLDREKLTQDLNTSFTISDGTKDHSVSVSAKKVTKQSKMEVSPTELDFGESKSELSLTIKNTGTANLNWEIDKLTESSLSVSDSEGVIEPNGTKVVKVKLDRSKMTGDINTTFVVSDGTSDKPVIVKAVKNTAEAVMKITPSEIDFGQDSSEEYIIIKNEGTAALKWTLNQISEESISVSDTAGVVNPGGSKVLKVSLDREIMPNSISTSLIFSDGTHEEVVIVRGTRVDKKANMVVSPTELDFGEEEKELTILIDNTGTADLEWKVEKLTESLITLSDESGVVEPAGTKVVKVKLDRENMTKDLSTTFVVTDGAKEISVKVLAKHVANAAKMTVSPLELDFEEDKTELNIEIKNVGSADLNWSVNEVNDTFITLSQSSGKVSVNGTTTVKVTLKRSAMTEDLNTAFNVSDGVNNVQVVVKATYVFVEDYSSAVVNSCDTRIIPEIVSCKREGTSVIFAFRLTNKGLGLINSFRIWSGYDGDDSIIYDDLGTNYNYNSTIIEFRGESNNGNNVNISASFPEDVPCNGTVTIINVPANAKKIFCLLKVTNGYSASFNKGTDRIEFKQVPIY